MEMWPGPTIQYSILFNRFFTFYIRHLPGSQDSLTIPALKLFYDYDYFTVSFFSPVSKFSSGLLLVVLMAKILRHMV